MDSETLVLNSDGYYKNNNKNIFGAVIIGAIFVIVHFLNTTKIMDLEMDTTKILYVGIGLVIFGLFFTYIGNLKPEKKRVFYTVENNILTISGAQNNTVNLEDYIVTGKITRANLGKTVTCTLKLEPRKGKKLSIICLLDEESFRKLLEFVA